MLGHEHRPPPAISPGGGPQGDAAPEVDEEQRKRTLLQQELGILDLTNPEIREYGLNGSQGLPGAGPPMNGPMSGGMGSAAGRRPGGVGPAHPLLPPPAGPEPRASPLTPAALERQVELLTTSIKERLEGAVNTPMSPVVVGALFPALMQVLGRHPADLSLPLDAPASRLRTAAVDLLGRLSIPELPKSFVADLLSACHAVLMTDHEANGMVVQTSYAHSIAFVIEHCPEQLPLTQEVVSFLADACTIMETDMAKVTARVTVRGQPPRAEVVGKLQVACVEVLVAALGWRAFRPILTDLAFYHKLTLQLLTHLHHLLDLLSGQFNVTLGEKITEHLKKWVDAEKWISPQPPQPVAWEPGTECEVAASMLDIFHKLPAQAKRFLESQGDRPGIVVLTIGLENALPKLPGPLQPSRLTSPYRPALTRFLNVYPQDTVDYFLDVSGRLANAEYFRRLLDVIRTPLGRPILDALAGQATRLALLVRPEASGGADGVAGEAAPVPLEAALHVVHLVRAMTKLLPDWLPHELYAVLLARAENGCGTSRAAERESRRLGKCLLAYVNAHHEEYAALFDLLTILSTKPSVDFGFVKEYLTTTVAKTYNTEEKRTVGKGVNALRHFINPLMKWTLASEGPGILTKDIVSSLVADVFQTPDQGRPSEQAQQELNMLCSTLIQHAHTLFVDHRKELIHFGWWALKFDNVAKPSAFLFLAHFLRVFPTPEKIMLQVYVALARMTQQESAARDVVRQAVDTLLPIFDAGRALGQEPETPPSGDATAFMASMVQNASKLGLPTNATLEARILATDMAAVLLSWDARAEAEAAAAAADGVPAATEGATATAEGSAAAASSAAVALLAPQASGEKEGSGTPPEGTEAVTGDGSAGQAPASRAALVAAAASAR
ncbi:putative transcription-associated protein 1 [Auxenochlorella protothecoides]|uniref:Putative transcription-associated protein 1 n=1 Tax=Auxenochlorella protothecoides TaxID=3075 RepID=A0A087ST98_AUXPR|nr:putative transcription-associated protein 1 [Auxenochlorella protothecoides]KFM28952.1 putative transcription-associated protein 1 [Auxenochlorella protothecoides]